MNPPDLLTRREAVARLALLLGGTLAGGAAWLRGSPVADKTLRTDFTPAQLTLLDEIGETIIPASDTPGAKAAGIGAFMAMMVNDCYDDANHAAFRAGLAGIDAAARTRYGADFVGSTRAQRTALLNELDREQREQRRGPAGKQPAHYFRLMKELTLLGYFTSEVGATKALRFVETPGSFDGNAPYRPGDRAWYTAPARSLQFEI